MAIAIKEKRPVRGVEAIAERPDGTLVPFMPFPTPLHDSEGRMVGAINMLVDISERKKAENRQKTLIDELNHRVKNTLATVQSLALQTARHSQSLQDFTQRFEERLLGLARAHDLLTSRHWEHAPLDTLVREVLGAVSDNPDERMLLDGPAILLSPKSALSLTMALNELATNATKYGAWSTEGGTLSLSWREAKHRNGAVLEFMWEERGGPPVKAPTRRGFGTRMIERCFERDFGGEVELMFEPSGLVCRMSMPLANV